MIRGVGRYLVDSRPSVVASVGGLERLLLPVGRVGQKRIVDAVVIQKLEELPLRIQLPQTGCYCLPPYGFVYAQHEL